MEHREHDPTTVPQPDPPAAEPERGAQNAIGMRVVDEDRPHDEQGGTQGTRGGTEPADEGEAA